MQICIIVATYTCADCGNIEFIDLNALFKEGKMRKQVFFFFLPLSNAVAVATVLESCMWGPDCFSANSANYGYYMFNKLREVLH